VIKKRKDTESIPPSLHIDERCLFTSQGEEVLKSYRIARLCLAAVLPCFSILTLFFTYITLAFSLALGISLFLLFRKKYGNKAAAAPGITALIGTGIGFFLLPCFLSHGIILKGGFHGF